MKGGEEEDNKPMGPLFPRLHVNDTHKGGPRAPPRNKMALYEQLSIPSQRLSSISSVLPPPPPQAGNLGPSTSSSQVCGHGTTVFSSFYTPSQIPEKINRQSCGGINPNSGRMELEKHPKRDINKVENATGSVAECNSRKILENKPKSSSGKKLGDEDDFRVPILFHPEVPTHSNKNLMVSREKSTPFCAQNTQKNCSVMLNSSAQSSKSNEKHAEGIKISDVKSRGSLKNNEKQAEEKFVAAPVSGEKMGKSSEIAKVMTDREQTSSKNSYQRSRNGDVQLSQESCAHGGVGAAISTMLIGMKRGLSAKADFKMNRRNMTLPENGIGEGDDIENGSLELRGEHKDEKSDSSMVDSISELEISPDDVVAAIGPKHFWKARRAIVNQQRVFAVQVFELHRLIKVQKLIAASPHLLLDGNPLLGKVCAPPTKKLPFDKCNMAADKDDPRNSEQQKECPKENTEGNTLLPSSEDGLNKAPGIPVTANGHVSGNPQATPITPDNPPGGWCLSPPNQWLVPVMSPSEGLVFKPYSGLCPPPGSFMAPFYAGCGAPLSLPLAPGDFMNSAYGAPAMAPSFFPPFGLPVMSTTSVEQASHLAVLPPNGLAEQNSHGSCNMSRAGRLRFQASKDSELQGSSATSPLNKAQEGGRDALLLFPMAPAAEGLPQPSHGSRDSQTLVIKVVPHNARSASESAARIFRSIQKDRRQSDL